MKLDRAAFDALVLPALEAARIPGAALAVVAGDEVILAQGFGVRDLDGRLPMTPETIYPIASTTKSLNATLIGLLVEEGRFAWDTPVQSYLPDFRLGDLFTSSAVTLRDLLTLRTGLPRHDWTWLENPIDRGELVARLRHLGVSAPLRSRFQYNNLTATTAGYIAEVVMQKSWEELLKERLLQPLGMSSTTFELPGVENETRSYHENSQRRIEVTQRLATEVTAPSGGSVHSTVLDMARWVALNLNSGRIACQSVVKAETLREIHTPQVFVGAEPSSPAPNSAYAMGWFAYYYNGYECLSHGGYLHDVNSDVMLFPKERIGVVCFTNFGFPSLARHINYHAVGQVMGFRPAQTLQATLDEYERKVVENRKRIGSSHRVMHTAPSHSLRDYAGNYLHPGYGRVSIEKAGAQLVFHRNRLIVPLEHWHYDVWVPQDLGRFFVHIPHSFDRSSRIMFESNADGEISALSIPLEPAVAAIRFTRQASRSP